LIRAAGSIGATTLAAVLCLAAPGVASAQSQAANYPTKEIQLMIPFAPGGGVDLFGRTVARVLNEEKIVTRRIQVVNKPGAGGASGMAEIVQRKGDPYHLLGIAIHVHVTPLTLGTKHSYKDLTPIARLFSEYQMMVVRAESPIKNLKQVEAALRKDAGSLKFGGATVGNADHMTVAKFAQTVGADPAKLTYVAYSGGESNAAILGGHVDVGMGGLDLMDLVEAGKMRVLAVSAPNRLGGRFKAVPTFVEQGYDVVNQNWRGIFAPPGISPQVVQYWRDALAKMVQTKSWKAELEKNQWVPTFEADTFVASLDKDHEVYRSLLQKLGLLK
jgi:putative tricarboxylic transport membrane protein